MLFNHEVLKQLAFPKRHIIDSMFFFKHQVKFSPTSPVYVIGKYVPFFLRAVNRVLSNSPPFLAVECMEVVLLQRWFVLVGIFCYCWLCGADSFCCFRLCPRFFEDQNCSVFLSQSTLKKKKKKKPGHNLPCITYIVRKNNLQLC